jgi:hypothetical protein
MRDMAVKETLTRVRLFIFNGLDVFLAFLSRDKIVVNFSNYYIIFLLLLNLNEKENIIQ